MTGLRSTSRNVRRTGCKGQGVLLYSVLGKRTCGGAVLPFIQTGFVQEVSWAGYSGVKVGVYGVLRLESGRVQVPGMEISSCVRVVLWRPLHFPLPPNQRQKGWQAPAGPNPD